MGSRVAGVITRLANNLLRLEYDPAYAASIDATPLSLPLAVRTHVGRSRSASSRPIASP
jgi:hypothetical protein